ncbi:MAG: TetR/AcrR family transcriptional regulator [Gammaproteobacteria bacterium]|nr:TetR/AcrR family transcriptional regulator [Gammaproteobacteria bacterium]
MNTASRKQREIAAREELILDCAARLLGEVGYQGLSMDRVAEAVEYSKGTIYQHFDCKEDLLAGLCLRSSQDLYDLFSRAAGLDLSPRERLIAIAFAYQLFIRLHPLEFANMQTLKSATVREKTSAENRCAMQTIEAQVMNTLTQVVRDGVSSGDLTLPQGLTCEELIFCLWATQYGAASLGISGIPFADYGVPSIAGALQKFNNNLLDGLNWHPVSKEFDYAATQRYLEQQVFNAELRMLQDDAETRQRKSS